MTDQLTFTILAGGQGRRLQGADKGLVEVAGGRMIDWVLMNVPDGCHTLIVANRNVDIYGKLGPTVIRDPWSESLGPLAGMLSALRAAETEWVQVLACDGLRLPVNLSQRLLLEVQEQACVAAYPMAESQGQYLHVLLNRRIEPHLAEALERGERSVRRWLTAIEARAVAIEESAVPLIWSVNTPDEKCRAEEQLYSLVGNG